MTSLVTPIIAFSVMFLVLNIMRRTLKGDWIWILGPIVVVGTLVFILLIFTTDDNLGAAFTYNLR